MSKLAELESLWLEIVEKQLNYDFAEQLTAFVSSHASLFPSAVELDIDHTNAYDFVTALAVLHIDIKIRIAKEVLARGKRNSEFI